MAVVSLPATLTFPQVRTSHAVVVGDLQEEPRIRDDLVLLQVELLSLLEYVPDEISMIYLVHGEAPVSRSDHFNHTGAHSLTHSKTFSRVCLRW